MNSEGGVHFERQGLLPPWSLIRVKATALLCSLNIVAFPAQDEPTCICGRGCLAYPPLLAWPRSSYPTSSVPLRFTPLKRCSEASVVRA
jgi:hypothetical protein